MLRFQQRKCSKGGVVVVVNALSALTVIHTERKRKADFDRYARSHPRAIALCFAFPWASFYVSEALQMSGVVTLLFCGVVMARHVRPLLSEPRRAPGFRPNAREIRPPRGLGLDAGEARVTLDDGPPVLVPPAARQPLELDDGLDLAAGNDRERRVVAVVHGEDRVGARRRPDRVRRARLGERGLVPGAP